MYRGHEAGQDFCHVCLRRGGRGMESHLLAGPAREHAVEHEGVYVHVQVEGTPESLEYSNAPAALSRTPC